MTMPYPLCYYYFYTLLGSYFKDILVIYLTFAYSWVYPLFLLF